MRKKKKRQKKKKKITSLDLHGVKHKDVEITVENFILENENKLPVDVITGYSDKMKQLVINVLEYHNFEYMVGDYYNNGYIRVIK